MPRRASFFSDRAHVTCRGAAAPGATGGGGSGATARVASMAVALVATRKFSVLERLAPRGAADGVALPRVAAADVAAPRTLALLRDRGYVIVTALGAALERAIADHEHAFSAFFAEGDVTATREERSGSGASRWWPAPGTFRFW